MSASPVTTGSAASPRRLRRVLAVILLVCGALAVAGYFYGGWLLRHPPVKSDHRPGH